MRTILNVAISALMWGTLSITANAQQMGFVAPGGTILDSRPCSGNWACMWGCIQGATTVKDRVLIYEPTRNSPWGNTHNGWFWASTHQYHDPRCGAHSQGFFAAFPKSSMLQMSTFHVYGEYSWFVPGAGYWKPHWYNIAVNRRG